MSNYKGYSDVRDRLQKQKEQWLREREIEQQAQDLEVQSFNSSKYSGARKSSSQRGQMVEHERTLDTRSKPAYEPQMVNNLFAKISTKLEEKYQQLPPRQGGQNDSLKQEVMSNTCPVCYELLCPPNHAPYILFPCGHTFCKACIEKYAKQKKMCPFCRQEFKSMAPNISLQNMIMAAHKDSNPLPSTS